MQVTQTELFRYAVARVQVHETPTLAAAYHILLNIDNGIYTDSSRHCPYDCQTVCLHLSHRRIQRVFWQKLVHYYNHPTKLQLRPFNLPDEFQLNFHNQSITCIVDPHWQMVWTCLREMKRYNELRFLRQFLKAVLYHGKPVSKAQAETWIRSGPVPIYDPVDWIAPYLPPDEEPETSRRPKLFKRLKKMLSIN